MDSNSDSTQCDRRQFSMDFMFLHILRGTVFLTDSLCKDICIANGLKKYNAFKVKVKHFTI